jgi:hypothetical protein
VAGHIFQARKRRICTFGKKIQFGKISAQPLVIIAEKVWSHCFASPPEKVNFRH